jgi:hypothetical protein
MNSSICCLEGRRDDYVACSISKPQRLVNDDIARSANIPQSWIGERHVCHACYAYFAGNPARDERKARCDYPAHGERTEKPSIFRKHIRKNGRIIHVNLTKRDVRPIPPEIAAREGLLAPSTWCDGCRLYESALNSKYTTKPTAKRAHEIIHDSPGVSLTAHRTKKAPL